VILYLLIRFCWPFPLQSSPAASGTSHKDGAQP
jgi:hypothetical protein